jgi:hypothetical protein
MQSRDDRLTPPPDADLGLLLGELELNRAGLTDVEVMWMRWITMRINQHHGITGAHTGSICELRAKVEALQSSLAAAAARVEALELLLRRSIKSGNKS